MPLDLAEQRAATISDVHYDLAFTIPESPDTPIPGHATIRFTLSDASSPVVLDFSPDTKSNPQNPQNLQNLNGHVFVPTSQLNVGSNTVSLDFVAGNAALNRNPDFLYTLFVPARAHLAFPCFDQPDMKARYTLSLTLPAALDGGRQRPRSRRATPAGGAAAIRYAETAAAPHVPVHLRRGKFPVETAERNGRTFRMFHRETDAAKRRAQPRRARSICMRRRSRGSRITPASRIPFGKFDFVLIPSFQFGGMEHAGRHLLQRRLPAARRIGNQNQLLNRASVIAHETSHMWFGDLVTMRWFDDVWMKEVFANFMAAKIVNPSFPDVNHDLRFLLSNYPDRLRRRPHRRHEPHPPVARQPGRRGQPLRADHLPEGADRDAAARALRRRATRFATACASI